MSDDPAKKLGLLREAHTAKPSTARVLLLLWGVSVLVVWIYISVTTQQLVPIDQSIVALIGILTGSKAIQRFGEN